MNKNKICFVIGSRAHYARIKPILRFLPKSNYRIILIESASISEFGNIAGEIEKDFNCCNTKVLYTNISGSNLVTMTKSAGVIISELATEFDREKPDVVVVIADRYEALAAGIAARYMNIPLAHIQGGENTGTIDDTIRHSLTKLANLHFVSNDDCAERVAKMGEDKNKIFVTGCPTMDICKNLPNKSVQSLFDSYGSNYEKKFELTSRYLMVTFHPVTTEYKENRDSFLTVLEAVNEVGIQSVWLYPNIDAGGDLIRKEIVKFKANDKLGRIHFFKHFPAEDYLLLVKNSLCCVGNSSVGVRETSFLGTPSVNIGSRQRGRTRSPNVIDCNVSKKEIVDAINFQVNHGPYAPSNVYGDGEAGKRIAEKLLNNELDFNKIMTY